MKILSKNSAKKSADWSWSAVDLMNDPKKMYLEFIERGMLEADARRMAGFTGTIIRSRGKANDGYPHDWDYEENSRREVEWHAEQEEKKSVIYSLANTIKLYSEHKHTSEVLLGYKSEMDMGCFYSPYLPLMMSRTTYVVGPSAVEGQVWFDNADSTVKIMTRYGVRIMAGVDDNAPSVQDYFNPQLQLFK